MRMIQSSRVKYSLNVKIASISSLILKSNDSSRKNKKVSVAVAVASSSSSSARQIVKWRKRINKDDTNGIGNEAENNLRYLDIDDGGSCANIDGCNFSFESIDLAETLNGEQIIMDAAILENGDNVLCSTRIKLDPIVKHESGFHWYPLLLQDSQVLLNQNESSSSSSTKSVVGALQLSYEFKKESKRYSTYKKSWAFYFFIIFILLILIGGVSVSFDPFHENYLNAFEVTTASFIKNYMYAMESPLFKSKEHLLLISSKISDGLSLIEKDPVGAEAECLHVLRTNPNEINAKTCVAEARLALFVLAIDSGKVSEAFVEKLEMALLHFDSLVSHLKNIS